MTRAKIEEPPLLATDLKTLFLSAVGQNWQRMAEEARRRRQGHVEYLADLMSLEVSKRRERRIQRRTKDAKSPLLKTLDCFDFSKQPELDQADVLELFDGRFVGEARNVVLMGPVGTGKTHLAIALGIACCQQEKRVRFTTAAELTNMLVEAKQDGRLSRKLEQLARFDLVVLDELGYVPFDKESADLLFGFITKVYERRSLVVTTNLPFSRWTEVFGDATAAAAVIDRIVHHSSVFKTEGGSYRLQAAKKSTRKRGKTAARS